MIHVYILGCMGWGYCCGMLNPAYLFGRLKGFDIREAGSGNAGATNAMLNMGLFIGILVMIVDVLKAVLAVHLAKRLFPAVAAAYALTGLFCALGHMFPAYLNFRGGKGTACLAGIVLSYSPKLFLLMVAMAFGSALIIDYIRFAPVLAAASYTVLYGYQTRDLTGTLCFVALALIMAYKHRDNIQRVLQGQELHFSYLWKRGEAREAELKRVRDNGGEIEVMR